MQRDDHNLPNGASATLAQVVQVDEPTKYDMEVTYETPAGEKITRSYEPYPDLRDCWDEGEHTNGFIAWRARLSDSVKPLGVKPAEVQRRLLANWDVRAFLRAEPLQLGTLTAWPRSLGIGELSPDAGWPEDLIDGFIQARCLNVIYGHRGQYKSPISYGIEAAIGLGRADFLGRKVTPGIFVPPGLGGSLPHTGLKVITESQSQHYPYLCAAADDPEASIIPGMYYHMEAIPVTAEKLDEIGNGPYVLELLEIDTVRDTVEGGYSSYAALDTMLKDLKTFAWRFGTTVIVYAHSSEKGNGDTITGFDGWIQHADVMWRSHNGVLTCQKYKGRDYTKVPPIPFAGVHRHGGTTVAKPKPPKMARDDVISRMRVMLEGPETLSVREVSARLANDSGYSQSALRQIAAAEGLASPRKPVTSKGKGRLRSV
jgi:hypothetical protein